MLFALCYSYKINVTWAPPLLYFLILIFSCEGSGGGGGEGRGEPGSGAIVLQPLSVLPIRPPMQASQLLGRGWRQGLQGRGGAGGLPALRPRLPGLAGRRSLRCWWVGLHCTVRSQSGEGLASYPGPSHRMCLGTMLVKDFYRAQSICFTLHIHIPSPIPPSFPSPLPPPPPI